MDPTRTYRYLLTATDILLIACAALITSKMVLFMTVPAPGMKAAAVEEPRKITSRDRSVSDSDVGVILDRNLFGSRTAGITAAPVQKTDEDLEKLPESTLPLKLLGTVVQVRGQGSFAIIQNTGTRLQQIYFVGDEVQEGIPVVSVARNRVVLSREGREEILEKTEDSSAPPAVRRQNKAARARPARTVQRADSSITVRKVGDNSFVMDRREVEGVLQDFNKLLTQIRVVPHFSDGEPDGFKIFNIRPGSLFAQIGMVNGDIIKRVNGLDITGPEQALQMFQQLRDESQVTVDLERFRKNLTLQYDIR